YYNSLKSRISICQHEFIHKRSTSTNLCSFYQFAVEILDNHGQVDVIYTDLSKAFDCISHSLLLTKLRIFGLSDCLLALLESYLKNRQQVVVYNGYSSIAYEAKTGVPQGSNLGPLLFLFKRVWCVYMNGVALTNSI
ncbi:hypothetical protein PPYR_12876, partial [Photinus pyralis]